MKKVFGLKEITGKVNELLMKEVKNRNNPENWNWTPFKPEKIKNLDSVLKEEREAVNYASMSNYIPSEKKQKVILIFAVGNLSYGFIKKLEAENIKFFYIDYSQFLLIGNINVSFENDKTTKMLYIDNLSVNLEDISAVIWNNPKHLRPLFDFDHIPNNENRENFIFKKRWVQFLRDLIHLLPETTIWLPGNPLNGSQEWQNKIGEYSLANSIGLKVPPTVFTNNKMELFKFIKNNPGEYVLREFSTPPFSFPPIRIDINNLNFDNFETSPVCFQKYIPKLFEYRVIVLFNKIFPCKIYSQDSELTKHDWRVHDDENVKWELAELPNDIKNKLISIKNKLNLNWCSIDIILGEDNEYYFLEANRPGAHYWLDTFIGLDITNEIIDELIYLNLTEKSID